MDKVIVKIKGRQKDASGEESFVEMMAEGKHYFRNGKHYVLYQDKMLNEDSETDTVLKISSNSLLLLRKGGVCHEQLFEPDKTIRSDYKTPYGKMMLEVRTKRLSIVCGSISGNIEIDYEMLVNGKWQSSNQLNIEIDALRGESSRLN